MGRHVAAFGSRAAWTPEEIEATVRGDAETGCWSEEESSVIRLADQLHHTSGVGDDAWQAASSHFAADQLIELVTLAGLYHAVSFMVNAFGVQHEESAPSFPRVA